MQRGGVRIWMACCYKGATQSSYYYVVIIIFLVEAIVKLGARIGLANLVEIRERQR